jgi:hypothetical protein
MRTPQIEPLYRAAVIARWCDVSCSMLQTFFLMNHYTSVVPHVRTCFLNVHTLQIERYIGRVLLSATLGTDLVVFPHGVGIICCSACITLHCWIRDLCADGDIESQPGPRYITKNVNSISGPGKLYQTFLSIRNESDRDPITSVLIQDHRIMAAKAN